MPLNIWKNSYRLTREKCCDLSRACIFDWIIFILAGNEDKHKSLDEFEFRPDSTCDGVESDIERCMQITNSVVCDTSKGVLYKQIKPLLMGEHAFPLT